MALKIISTTSARNQMASIVKGFIQDDTPCFITHNGQARAVLMDIHRYNIIVNFLKDLQTREDSQLWKDITRARKDYAIGKGINLQTLLKK